MAFWDYAVVGNLGCRTGSHTICAPDSIVVPKIGRSVIGRHTQTQCVSSRRSLALHNYAIARERERERDASRDIRADCELTLVSAQHTAQVHYMSARYNNTRNNNPLMM